MPQEVKVPVFNPFRPMFATIKETAFGIGVMSESGVGFSMKPEQAEDFANKLLDFTRRYLQEKTSQL